MALGAPISRVYTKEQIEQFYLLFKYENENGINYDAPIRQAFKDTYGMEELNQYRKFCEDATKIYPNLETTTFPSLKKMIKDMAHKKAKIMLSEEELERKRRCSIM